MTQPNYSDILAATTVFNSLPREICDQLAVHLTLRDFWPGERVLEQGGPGDEMFVVLQGELKAVVLHEDIGFEREVYRLVDGDSFGENAAITGNPYTHSVLAVTAGQMLALSGAVLREMLAAHPQIAVALSGLLIQQIETFIRREAVVPFVQISDFPDARRLCNILAAKTARGCKALVLGHDSESLKIGMVYPFDAKLRTILQDELRQHTLEFFAIGEREFHDFVEDFLKPQIDPDDQPKVITYVDPAGKEHGLGDHQTAEVLEEVFLAAITSGASDLHFEPAEPASRIRMRQDGNMVILRKEVPNHIFPKLISRLKVISDLDITNRRLPQDGRFPIIIGQQRVEVRLSITPCQGGEKAVLRILDQRRQRLNLQELVVSPPVCAALTDVLSNSSGMILVTGPTGSGKTTTLYACLSEIWRASKKVNIVTIEDPVEYQLPYATQIQVNHSVGLEFAQILRTALRQDPDVILVGEIRDRESAGIALETATTGHLVLSSLHTDSALEAVLRLRKLDVKSYLLANALKCVLSQRLVARICEKCRQAITPDARVLGELQQMKILPADFSGQIFKGKGCNACRFDGDLGRVAFYEMLMINEALRDMIEREASMNEMLGSLSRDSFISMRAYARMLLTQGMVSAEQIRSVFPRYSLLDSGSL